MSLACQNSNKMLKALAYTVAYTVEKGARIRTETLHSTIWLELLKKTSNETSALDVQSILTTMKVKCRAYSWLNMNTVFIINGVKYFVVTDITPISNGFVTFNISSKNAK